jgi:lupus La protein
MSAAIREQLEFYFGDANIVRDNFLKEQIADDEEGFVKLSVFLKFKKLNNMLKEEGITGTEDHIVAELAKAVAESDALLLSEDNKSVRRKNPLPASVSNDSQTAYVKFIPAKATSDEMRAFFGQFGKCQAAWRRYGGQVNPSQVGSAIATTDDGKVIKESAFIVFEDAASIKKLQDAAATFPGSSTPLVVMPKSEYLAKKAAERNANGAAKGGSKAAQAAAASKTSSGPWPRDAALTVSNAGEFGSFKAVKELWETSEQPGLRYVSISDDKQTATIICQDKETRERLIASVENRGAKINDKVPTITRVPSGEQDEKAEAEKSIADMAAARANFSGGRGGGRGGRGGRGRGGRGNFGGNRRQRE